MSVRLDDDDDDILDELEARAELDRARLALYEAAPRSADLTLDDEHEPVAKWAKRKRSEDGLDRRRRRDRAYQQSKRTKPAPYAALAGRQLVARQRILSESRTRKTLLVKALKTPGSDRTLLALRSLEDARRFEVVTAWRVRELLRASLLREPKLNEIADNMPRLKTSGPSKLTHIGRLLERGQRLEAASVWQDFNLLDTV